MKEKIKKKRQLILDAALRVFVKNGYEKTKIIDIAETAGIGKGTVYEYFDSKEELFRYILDEYCDLYKNNVTMILEEKKECSCKEKLLAVMHMENDLKEQVHLYSLNPVRLMQEFSNFPGLKQAIQEMLRFKFHTVCILLREGIETGEFRTFNVPLATAALMGAASTMESLAICPGDPACCEDAGPALVSPEMLEEFSDENLLDLMIQGMGF